MWCHEYTGADQIIYRKRLDLTALPTTPNPLPRMHLPSFISSHVTGRTCSMFRRDLEMRRAELEQEIAGRSVLVIGGAGTIGASFIRVLLQTATPARLFVVDINENGLTELTRDLRSTPGLGIPTDYKTYPINFGDVVFQKLLRQEGPFDIIANFAAHKHVRSEKDPYAIEAMLENNVFRAKALLDWLSETPPRHFFCVSTDKAANPVNIMGASKKLMEEVLLAYSPQIPVKTARFANVAFSNGSLPAGFLERIARQQPISAPLDIRRYFVSPEEAGEICLMACLLGQSGTIFFPRLDPERDMQSFTHIADRLLEAYGYTPVQCASEESARERVVEIADGGYPVFYFSSDTSGEKTAEEFFTEEETPDFTSFQALGILSFPPTRTLPDIEAAFAQLRAIFQQPALQKEDIVAVLAALIPQFQHQETGKHLDQKM